MIANAKHLRSISTANRRPENHGDYKFTKVLFAVELGGQAFSVELGNAQLLQLLQRAAELSPTGSWALSPLPDQRIFEAVFESTAQD